MFCKNAFSMPGYSWKARIPHFRPQVCRLYYFGTNSIFQSAQNYYLDFATRENQKWVYIVYRKVIENNRAPIQCKRTLHYRTKYFWTCLGTVAKQEYHTFDRNCAAYIVSVQSGFSSLHKHYQVDAATRENQKWVGVRYSKIIENDRVPIQCNRQVTLRTKYFETWLGTVEKQECYIFDRNCAANTASVQTLFLSLHKIITLIQRPIKSQTRFEFGTAKSMKIVAYHYSPTTM